MVERFSCGSYSYPVCSVEVIWKSAPAIDYLALLQVNDSVFMSGKTQLFVDDQLKETFEGNPDLAYDQ